MDEAGCCQKAWDEWLMNFVVLLYLKKKSLLQRKTLPPLVENPQKEKKHKLNKKVLQSASHGFLGPLPSVGWSMALGSH